MKCRRGEQWVISVYYSYFVTTNNICVTLFSYTVFTLSNTLSQALTNTALTHPLLTLITYQGCYLTPWLCFLEPTALKPCVERKELCIIH